MAENNSNFNYPSGQPNAGEIELSNARTKGIASLVLGIVALLCCFTGLGALLGFIAAIVGLVLGAKARHALPPGESGMATAGWVCSIVALCLCGLALLFLFGFLGLLGLGGFLGTIV